jgi:hypothetical protein
VLVLLQAVQQPLKPTDPALRPKQQPEAAALEAEVYAALEATPDNGKAFAAGAAGGLGTRGDRNMDRPLLVDSSRRAAQRRGRARCAAAHPSWLSPSPRRPLSSTAVRNTLKREEGWVQWKRGGPPPAPTPGAKQTACPDFARPPATPGLAAAVAEGEAAAAAAAAKARARREA